MAPGSVRITRRAARVFSLLAAAGLLGATGGCFSNAESPSIIDAGSGGNTTSGSGGSTTSGSGGSTTSGSGGSTIPGSGGAGPGADAGNGGAVGTGGSSGSGGASDGMDGGSGGVSGSGGTAGGTGGFTIGPVVSLPVTVTDVFDNQGWFGDAQEMMAFTPGSTIISQAEATTGPCGKRVANARGKCLKVVFTPPPNVTPFATGGFIGVFFLTTDKAAHPDATPPEMIGQANWGASEPGVNIAPGAAKIAFRLAGDVAGQTVAVKAGAGPDSFQVPETAMTTKTTWQAASLPLTGKTYGMNVVGGFAWVLTDTSKALTFYLDDIVWTM